MIWIIISVILLGFYNGYLLLDDKTTEQTPLDKSIERKWHFVGSLIFLYIGFLSYKFLGWKYIPFSLASFWIIFAGIVHIIGMKKSFFYVGTFSLTDRISRRIFPKNTELITGIIKTIIWISSILLVYL